MTRVTFRACLCILLPAIVIVDLACSSNSAKSPAPEVAIKSPRNSGSTSASDSSKLLANWPKPLAVLVVSGEMDGYLEPCGCAQGQLGGLVRRADFVDRLRGQNWPVALIDLGCLIKDPAASRGGSEQAKIKFGIALKALSALKYDAVALAAEDLKVGVGEAFAQFLNNLTDPTQILVANVQPAAGFETKIQPSRIISVGPLKLGVTAVIDPAALDKLADPDKGELLPTVKRPDDVLGSVLSELEGKSDYQVLMVQGPAELAKRLATAHPGFDVVVATSPSDEPAEREMVPLNGGKTMLISVGKRGKYVGAVGFFADPEQRMRFYLLTLNNRYDRPGAAIKKIIQDEYRSMLKAAGVVENFPRHDYAAGTAGASYVGAETCKQCHPNTYMKWSTTKHSQAFIALEHDPKPDTVFDAECVSCHTTGFGYTSGWRSEAATSYLKGNQCENCHGPGSKHVSNPDNLDYRRPMKLTAEQANKNGLCIHCHDEDNSPKFNDFAVAWSQIVHKGLDDYTNPRVHQGITPKVARTPEARSEK
jgi:hypothetical protein